MSPHGLPRFHELLKRMNQRGHEPSPELDRDVFREYFDH
jgi:hypothetical protein